MGVKELGEVLPQATIPPGSEQDAILHRVAGEIADKGFVVASLDKIAAS